MMIDEVAKDFPEKKKRERKWVCRLSLFITKVLKKAN
jgi:hypothetical protein